MGDECVELKNIKYQTMLLNSNSKVDSQINNTENLDSILEKENIENRKKPWSKLGISVKIRKINHFIERYNSENKLNPKEKEELKNYLKTSVQKKKLQRAKDVVYDISSGKIKSIPGLSYDKNKKRFTLRRIDKKNSTLKGLAEKKNPKTKRKKVKIYLKKKEDNKIKKKEDNKIKKKKHKIKKKMPKSKKTESQNKEMNIIN